MTSETYNGQSWVAFTDVIGPNGETWHITVRDGVDPEKIEELFDALLCAGSAAGAAGFSLLSEMNEFSRKMTVGALAERREKAKAERARRANQSPEQPKEQPKKQQKPGEKAADGRTVGRSAARPQQPASAPRGNNPLWDLKKTPIECNKIEVGGKKDEAKLSVWCASPGLKHAAFHCPAQIMLDAIVRKYRVDADTTRRMLFDIGTEIDLKPPWLYHWAPSPKEAKYKDLVDVTVPKLEHLKRETPLTREQLAVVYGFGDPPPSTTEDPVPPVQGDEIPPGMENGEEEYAF